MQQDVTAQIEALEEKLGGGSSLLAAFTAELSRLREAALYTNREVSLLSSGFSGGLRRAFDGLVFDGVKLSSALGGLAQSLSETLYAVAMRPVQQAAGAALAESVAGLFGDAMPFAKGAGFVQGRVMPFAAGGVVSGPVSFALRQGRGLMGEAGPEAIMPLARGADGRLGVQAATASRPVNVTMQISSPDVQGFRRSESQIAAQMARALARGQRNR